MNKLLGIALAMSCLAPAASAQTGAENMKRSLTPVRSTTSIEYPAPPRIAGKKASQYTAEDWGARIDSTWGPGQSASDQQLVFDTFWSAVDRQWAGFPNLPLNWDSIRTLYRPQIGSGLSRGRFASLMSRVQLALQEYHTGIIDFKVDTTFGLSSVRYRSGIPLLLLGSWTPNYLGAGITPLPDSTSFVYRAAAANPLGLEPGDLLLGYEGIPWKRLYPQLMNAGVPVSYLYSANGSTPEAMKTAVLMGVGFNWGMFDTIDVVKYKSGDTVHLPTSVLTGITEPFLGTDQVPVSGVPMPQGAVSVSWGVVQGTNTGYIYVLDWFAPGTSQLFRDAVNDLRYVRNVDGLVIDFRENSGGEPSYADEGFAQLFGFDPTGVLSVATRTSASDHMGFTLSGSNWRFPPKCRTFQHPIAMLIGPGCISAGDNNALRLKLHPMTRSFGKATNGAFVAGNYFSANFSDAWYYQGPTNTVYYGTPGSGYLAHRGVQPDEEVWLTRDGAARGEDDVVKRAIDWLNSLTYAYDAQLDRTFARPGLDSICITATLRNPLHHTAVLSAIVTSGNGVVSDSVVLVNDGLHGDGGAGDSVWGVFIRAPLQKGRYDVAIRTDDISDGKVRRVPNVAEFGTGAYFAEDFMATGGTPLTAAGWTQSGTSTTNPITITSPGLSFANAGTSNAGNAASLTTTGQDVYHDFPFISSGSAYLSFMAKVLAAASGDYFVALSPTSAQTNYFARLHVKTAPGGFVVGISKSNEVAGGARYSPTVHPMDVTVQMVVKYTFVPGDSSDRISVFVFDTAVPVLEPASPEIADYVSTVKADAGNLGFVTLRQGTTGAAPTLVIDGIRVDTTWRLGVPTDVHEAPLSPPLVFELRNNYPNPFNPTTRIGYQVPVAGEVQLVVYDVLGREVSSLVRERKEPGNYEVTFDASGLSSGVYFYRMQVRSLDSAVEPALSRGRQDSKNGAGDFVQTHKLVLVR